MERKRQTRNAAIVEAATAAATAENPSKALDESGAKPIDHPFFTVSILSLLHKYHVACAQFGVLPFVT